MNYIVFDLEWNQPSARIKMITDPIKFSGEIIQIGAVKMNDKLQIIDTLDVMVQPIYYTKMNSTVEKLTGIGDDDLKRGIPFSEAYKKFIGFCGEDFCFLTWGNDDCRVLLANMTMHRIPTEIFPRSYNIQRIFGKQIAKTKKQIALETAVEMLGEPPYSAHNALNDAMSAALICKHIDLAQEKLTAKRADSNKKRIYETPDGYGAKLCCDPFCRSKKEGGEKIKLAGFMCACGKKKKDPIEWIRLGKIKWIASVSCDCGNEYFVCAMLKQRDGNDIRIDSSVEKMSDASRQFYLKNKRIDDEIKAYALKQKR